MWIEKNGPSWRIRDLVGGKKVTIAKGYATKTAARAAMVQAEADKLRGDSLVPRGGRILLGGWIDVWWPPYEVTLKASSRIAADGILRRYIRPMLGHVPLEDLQPLVVKRWIADLLAGRTPVKNPRKLSPKTVRNAHGLLHTIMRDAVSQRLIRSNPCERKSLPAKTHHEMRFLTEPEAERLVAALPEHWRPLIMLLLGTGLRWGEAIGLRVRHVDVLDGRLTVLVNTQELADTAEIVDEEPKSAAGRRTVTFTPEIAELLVPLTATRGRDERVFTAPKGGPVRTRVFYRVWLRTRAAAGLDGLRVHDLRHTHAAWLISDGTPLPAVQRRLGHTSISITSDLYGHLMPVVDENILKTLKKALPKIKTRGAVGETIPEQPGATRNSAEKPAGQDA